MFTPDTYDYNLTTQFRASPATPSYGAAIIPIGGVAQIGAHVYLTAGEGAAITFSLFFQFSPDIATPFWSDLQYATAGTPAGSPSTVAATLTRMKYAFSVTGGGNSTPVGCGVVFLPVCSKFMRIGVGDVTGIVNSSNFHVYVERQGSGE